MPSRLWVCFFGSLVALTLAQSVQSFWPQRIDDESLSSSKRADGTNIDPLDVMLVADLSGPTQSFGKDLASGFRDAISSFQLSNEIRLVERDDAGKIEASAALAEGAAAGYRSLALVGPTYDASIAAVEAAAGEGELALLVPIAKPLLATNGPWTFTLQSSMPLQGEMLGKILPLLAPAERIANFIHPGTPPNGLWGGILAAFRNKHDITLDQVNWASGQSVDEQKASIKEDLYYDAILISLPLDEAAEVVRNLRLFGFAGIIVIEGEALLGRFSEKFANDRREAISPGFFTDAIVGAVPFTPLLASSDSQKVIASYRRAYQNEPSWAYAYGYDAGLLVANFVVQARASGKFDLAKPDKMREALRNYLAELKDQGQPIGGMTGDLSFNTSRERQIPPRLIVYKGGRPAPFSLQISEQPSLGEQPAALGQSISIGDVFYNVVPVVETSIRLRDLSKLDLELGIFEATFDAWFKSSSAVRIEDITFLNQIGPLRSAVLTEEVRDKSGIARRYTIDGRFQYAPRAADTLLGRASIDLSWRHSSLNSQALHFVTDASRTTAAPRSGVANPPAAESIRDYRISSSYLAVGDQSLLALGDPRSSNGTLTYSVASYHADLARLESTLTSRVIAKFGLKNIHLALAMVNIVGLLLLIPKPWRNNRDALAIAQCCWIIIALVLSEISFFVSTLTDAFRLTDLLLIEKTYSLLCIFAVVRLIDVLLIGLWRKNAGEERAHPVLVFVTRIGLYFSGVAVFYTNILGKDILPVLATSSVLLTVVGLALRDLIFDAMAGVALTADRHIRIGEWISVRVRDRFIHGKVEGIGWRHSRVRSRDNQTHFIPNSAIATQVLSNSSAAGSHIRMECFFVVSAKVNLGEILPTLEQTLSQQFRGSRFISQEKTIKVLIGRLEDSWVQCIIQFFVSPDASTEIIRSEMLETVRKILAEHQAFAESIDRPSVAISVGEPQSGRFGHPMG